MLQRARETSSVRYWKDLNPLRMKYSHIIPKFDSDDEGTDMESDNSDGDSLDELDPWQYCQECGNENSDGDESSYNNSEEETDHLSDSDSQGEYEDAEPGYDFGDDELSVSDEEEASSDESNESEDEVDPFVGVGTVPVDASILTANSENECSNCWRRQITNSSRKYQLEFVHILSNEITNQALCTLKVTRPATVPVQYNLCQQCNTYLRKCPDGTKASVAEKRKDWKNSWPSFFRDLLFGNEKTSCESFYNIVGASKLWRFIPLSCRGYWRQRAKDFEVQGQHPYDGVISSNQDDEAPPYFVDRTEDLDSFNEHLASYQLGRWLEAYSYDSESKPMSIPDVLCPWGCSEFCSESVTYNLGILIQHCLPQIQLNLPKSDWFKTLHVFESSRLDYIRNDICDYDTVLMNDEWKVVPSVIMDDTSTLMVLTCSKHNKHQNMKRLHMHVPRKEHHTLSPDQSDQLSHLVVNPATLTTTRANKFSTSFRMSRQLTSWAGTDTCTVGSVGRFIGMSRMLSDSESLSLAQRRDIKALSSKNVQDGTMLPEYVTNLEAQSERLYNPERIAQLKVGSTFVSVDAAMDLHMDSTQDKNICIDVQRDKDLPTVIDIVSSPRSWLPLINYVQIEDNRDYGYPMKAVGNYTIAKGFRPSMMLWTLAGTILNCKELWKGIDQRAGNYSDKGWDGFMLTHLTILHLKHANVPQSKSASPFKKAAVSSTAKMLSKIESFMPHEMRVDVAGTEDDNMSETNYFGFDVHYWRRLFPESVYSSIGVCTPNDSMDHLNSIGGRQVIIKVILDERMGASNRPTCADDIVNIGLFKYEARVIVCLESKVTKSSGNDYNGCRFSRHGDGYHNWRKQLRGKNAKEIMTECRTGEPYTELAEPTFMPRLFATVVVYVKVDNTGDATEERKIDFHRSLGGQGHIACECNNYPLLITGRLPESRRTCIMPGCTEKEGYVCARTECRTRICVKCLKKSSENRISLISPPVDDDEHDIIRDGPQSCGRVVNKDGTTTDKGGNELCGLGEVLLERHGRRVIKTKNDEGADIDDCLEESDDIGIDDMGRNILKDFVTGKQGQICDEEVLVYGESAGKLVHHLYCT